ncbi:protease inhibitor-like [Drosophila serrata]|uniref:protease inhibitor-like n=1 Tax=Drosophila serrata TaxID=7274 RepID=UPI000A1D2840|nr:protease inhibitor-like [Drosophila serrata]
MLYQIFGLFFILGLVIGFHWENHLSDRALCHQPVHTGNCEATVFAWYYNPKKKSCLRFRYALCGGNSNRFYTKAECESICLKNW